MNFGKWQNEKGLRFCSVLDCNRDVYYDAASESRDRSHPYHRVSCGGVPSFLLLTDGTVRRTENERIK